MSVFGVMYKMEYFRENLHTKQKTSRKNPSTAYGGPLPLKGRLVLGSLEKGAGSRRLTEELLRKSFTPSKRFHKESLHRLAAVPLPFQGRLICNIGSPLGELSPQVTEGFFRET